MKALGLGRWALLTLLIVCLWGRSASAQEEGYQLNQLTPSPAGDAFTLVEYPWYSGPLFAADFTLDYARNSVVAEVGDAPVAHSQYGRFGIATALAGRFGLSLSLPILLFESGSQFNDIGPSGTVVSDPRLGMRVLLFGQPDSRFSLSASTLLWIPIGAQDDHAGDKGPRVLPRITGGGLAAGGRVRWGVNAGYFYRKTAQLGGEVSPIGNTVGSEVQVSAGVSYLDPANRFSVGPEATLSFSVDSDVPSEQVSELLEVYLTGRYAINQKMELGLGMGTAVRGSGPPEARALLSFKYAWHRPSPVLSSFELVVVLPDEDGHVGSIEVDDGKTKTVLDKAYASTELSKKDKQVRSVQSSATQVEEQAQGVAAVLPPLDSDRDGVADFEDVCPARAGTRSEDALRNGCPPASEKVVVLPDEDGHVGSIEVDDGTQVILIDKAYASAEVSSDGNAASVAPPAPKVAEKAIAGSALVLPTADRDGDSTADADDACPDRAGQASTDPLRTGCPAASEKVILLPDADGHIGSIEVDNGTSKTVLVTPYSSVEVASDGSAVAVPPPASPQVLQRAIAGMTAAMPVIDTDSDGIADAMDACPGRKGAFSAEPQRSGCPKAKETVVVLPDEDGTVGSLLIDDGKNQVVLDKAFARAEVGDDGQAQAVPGASATVVLRSVASLAKNLPKPDLDGDGIVDSHDACKDRKGPSNANAQRHGCPPSVERIVLLTDEDGHVGALEIGEGADQVVLDTPYASADISADGVAIKVDGAQREVDAEYAEVYAIAQAAKKARNKAAGRVHFVVYFDEKAIPTRDVNAQIEALLQALKGKTDYRIDVVGHTDATGSARANLRVGNARAAAIAKRLAAGGIPASKVSSSTRGSGEPAVEVVDIKVPEPLNRRVEIRIKKASDPHIIVNFDKRTKPTRNMRAEYRDFAKQLKGRSEYKLIVVGHADPTEDEGLALKRAEAVTRDLRRLRISKDQIETSSKGASEPAVESAEAGKLEPLNRRVEIFVQ